MKYALTVQNQNNRKMNREQQPVLTNNRITFFHKAFYWAQALILFGVVIAVGMILINWCINLDLFWRAR